MPTERRHAASHEELARLDREHLWHPFTPQEEWVGGEQVMIERGEGTDLITADGRRLIDGVSSLWCNVHGHRHPGIDAAVRAQLDRIAHSTMLGLSHPGAVELAARLVDLAPPGLSRVFYSDSGSTAAEIALKMAFQYHAQREAAASAGDAAAGPASGDVRADGAAAPAKPDASTAPAGGERPSPPRRTSFVHLRESYHGDTIGSVSVGGIELFHSTYGPLLFEAHAAEPGDAADLERILAERGEEVAAVIVEPLVQGAAGMLVHPPGYLRAVRELCDRHGALLICDEVATGFGRTGTMFACEQEGVAPDLMCLAKGITGGYLPLAATLTTEEVYRGFLGAPEQGRTFFHGHTYTGNPLACAAALASLDAFEEERTLEHLQPKIELFGELLAGVGEMPEVAEVRRCGFMAGIDLGEHDPARRQGQRVTLAARERGAAIRPLADVVILMPPLAIAEEDLRRLVEITAEAIRAAART